MQASAGNPEATRTLLPQGAAGFALFAVLLAAAFLLLPPVEEGPKDGEGFLITIGALAAWRYSWGLVNFARSLVYRKLVFPRWRGVVEANADVLMPSQIYLLMTVFKIKSETVIRTVSAMVREASACGVPVTIVASLVELQDEFLFKTVFEGCNPPHSVRLKIVRVPGTGKRDGLAHGFRAISRDMPAPDAVVAVLDADTVLLPGVLRRCAPFFGLRPGMGALTTDEHCEVAGSELMREWHQMRFAQRQIYMSSVSLSRRVMTLTGRMSMFRAEIVTHPDFIRHMTEDYLDHRRLGRFKFLTGDDKSSLYWVMRRGYEQIYVPDTAVLTLEDATHPRFVRDSTQLMLRWFGNMLRTNSRILRLGPARMPFFVWWSFVDQRISMWTSLSGPVFTAMLSTVYGPVVVAYYAVWVLFVRGLMSVILLSARNRISWRYPFLLYYSHIYGSLIKTWVLFRLDRQSWTRQKTKLQRNMSRGWMIWNRWSSHALHATAVLLLVGAIGAASDVVGLPHATLRMVFGPGLYPGL